MLWVPNVRSFEPIPIPKQCFKNWHMNDMFMFASFPHLLNYHQTTSLTVHVNVNTWKPPFALTSSHWKFPTCCGWPASCQDASWSVVPQLLGWHVGFVRINGISHPNISHLKVGYNPFTIAIDPKFLGHPNVTNWHKMPFGPRSKKPGLTFLIESWLWKRGIPVIGYNKPYNKG